MDSVDQILPYLQHPPVNRILKSSFITKLYGCDINKAHVDAAESILASGSTTATSSSSLSSSPIAAATAERTSVKRTIEDANTSNTKKMRESESSEDKKGIYMGFFFFSL